MRSKASNTAVSASAVIVYTPTGSPSNDSVLPVRRTDLFELVRQIDHRFFATPRSTIPRSARRSHRRERLRLRMSTQLVTARRQGPRLGGRDRRRRVRSCGSGSDRQPIGAGAAIGSAVQQLVFGELRALGGRFLEIGGNLFAEHRRDRSRQAPAMPRASCATSPASRRPARVLAPLASTGIVSVRTCAAAAMTRSAAASAASSWGESSAGTSTRSGTRLPIASSAPSVVSAMTSSAPPAAHDRGEMGGLAPVRFDRENNGHLGSEHEEREHRRRQREDAAAAHVRCSGLRAADAIDSREMRAAACPALASSTDGCATTRRDTCRGRGRRRRSAPAAGCATVPSDISASRRPVAYRPLSQMPFRRRRPAVIDGVFRRIL